MKVESVLAVVGEGEETKFLLKWRGFPPSKASWVPRSNMDCPDLVEEFFAKMAQRPEIRRIAAKVRLSAVAVFVSSMSVSSSSPYDGKMKLWERHLDSQLWDPSKSKL